MTRITGCRNCHADDSRLAEVLDLGQQYLPDFPHPDELGGHERTASWPLRLVHCAKCGLAQLDTTTPRELLYHDGYGYYSGVTEAIVADLRDVVQHACSYQPHPRTWLDVACNDGTLLGLTPPECYRVGIDPVPKFAPLAGDAPADVTTGYFPEDLPARFRPAPGSGDGFDVITAVSVFYDLDDPHAFLQAAADVLAEKGVLLVQQNYLLAMLQANAYDNLCHEHLTYWALDPFTKALKRHGLEAIDVRTSPVNGGVFRVVAGHRGVRIPAPSVAALRYQEARTLPGLLGGFGAAARLLAGDLHDLIASVAADGERVMLYGASTRGATIWQAARLHRPARRPLLEAAVERNPEKVGKRYAAVGGLPIISEEQMRADPPGYLLVGPWWLRDQLLHRERAFLEQGGRMVFPLPSVEVVGR